MDLAVLQLFVAVMRQGNFAAVARDRDCDPSSVSRAIAGLEKELGVRLFQRTTRRLSPTEAGATYFQHIEPLAEEIQRAADLAQALSDQPQGTLRVTASTAFGQTCIGPILPAFQATYPDLTVELLLTDQVVDLLADRIDLAIRLGPLADSTLIAQRLMATRYYVCASPDYLQRSRPTHPSDIQQHPCLLFPLPGFRSRWIFKDKAGQLSEVPVRGQTLISNAVALKDCAIAGMGLTLLPNWLVNPLLDSGALVNVFPDYAVTATDFNTAAWLVYPSRTYIPLKVQVFIERLKATFTPQSIKTP